MKTRDFTRVIRAKLVADPKLAEAVSAELMELARQAVAAQEARKNEDVREWAERLVRSVGDACD